MIGIEFQPTGWLEEPNIDQGRHVRSRPIPRALEGTRVRRSPGRSGFDIVQPPAFRQRVTIHTMALPGNPRGKTFRCGCPGFKGGRRRARSVVADLPASTARPRCSGDAGSPGRHRRLGGPDGRCSRTPDRTRDRNPGFPGLRPSGPPPGGPASHHRRGRERGDWRTATTPMERRRPASSLGEPHRKVLPRGLPGSAIVQSGPRSRWDLSKHNSVPGTPR